MFILLYFLKCMFTHFILKYDKRILKKFATAEYPKKTI